MKICMACGHRFEEGAWRCPDCNYVPAQQGNTLLFAPALAHGNNGFKAEHFSELAKLEPHHFWFRNRNRLLIWTMQKYFPEARSFLEVGCGTGFVSSGLRQALPGLEIAGSELFLEGIDFARGRLPDVPLYQMNAVHIPFDAEFDVIGAFDVLEHIEEDETVLRQLYQAVKPGGGLLITVPQHPALWSAADESACHKRRYTRQELLEKVESAGFKLLRLTSFMTLLLPFLWAARRTRNSARNLSTDAEFQINPMLNGLLESVLRLESSFIRLGASFSAGGSLLLAAQKSS
jgi:SAM-dependent methyltransferase